MSDEVQEFEFPVMQIVRPLAQDREVTVDPALSSPEKIAEICSASAIKN